MLVDASTGVVNVVERMHRTIQRRPAPLGAPVEDVTRGITGFVYRSIRGGMRLVGWGLDSSLAPLEGLLPAGQSTPGRDAFISIVNGVYGDYLARSGNPLAIEMQLLERAAPTRKLLIFVHGLCMSDQQWTHQGSNPGAVLAESLGYTPLYLRYNSGRQVADNGREFAALLEALIKRWPVAVDEISIVGHSMGGLVSRSACVAAGESRHRWRQRLSRLVFLGTPHQGAPLERGGHGLDFLLELSPYSAPFTRLGKARSAGIRDLRHGTITHRRHHSVALPRGVDCYAIAAVLGDRRGVMADHVVGDGLVPVASALGQHADRSRALRIPVANRWVGYRMGHLELLRRPEVYDQLRTWLTAR
jgi:pimeloyl-ACP methyl ester carboxylesterase